MTETFDLGQFDLDITLRDAALDEKNRPTRRMLANACIEVEAYDAYYSTRELHEALWEIHETGVTAKPKLAQVLSSPCDDLQRCLYYCLAGRGVVQMLDDLAWLIELLEARSNISASLFTQGRFPLIQKAPYISAEPDGPVPSATADFELGQSWYLDPELGGIVRD